MNKEIVYGLYKNNPVIKTQNYRPMLTMNFKGIGVEFNTTFLVNKMQKIFKIYENNSFKDKTKRKNVLQIFYIKNLFKYQFRTY